jgi:hypothetical protein
MREQLQRISSISSFFSLAQEPHPPATQDMILMGNSSREYVLLSED